MRTLFNLCVYHSSYKIHHHWLHQRWHYCIFFTTQHKKTKMWTYSRLFAGSFLSLGQNFQLQHYKTIGIQLHYIWNHIEEPYIKVYHGEVNKHFHLFITTSKNKQIKGEKRIISVHQTNIERTNMKSNKNNWLDIFQGLSYYYRKKRGVVVEAHLPYSFISSLEKQADT